MTSKERPKKVKGKKVKSQFTISSLKKVRRKKRMSRTAHEAEHSITWVQPGLREGTIALCNFCLSLSLTLIILCHANTSK